MQDSDPAEPEAIGPARLFIAFSSLALSGFGGVLPFAYRTLVERRGWLTPKEFTGLLAIAQVMPGPTICNVSVMIGQRFAGFPGAAAALGGMVLGPFFIVIALGVAWQHYGGIPSVKHALAGMSAVAIGLILSTAVKMGIGLFKPDDTGAPASRPVPGATALGNPADPVDQAPAGYWTTRRVAQMILCALAFAGVGLMRWPLVAVVAALAPFAIAVSWFMER